MAGLKEDASELIPTIAGFDLDDQRVARDIDLSVGDSAIF